MSQEEPTRVLPFRIVSVSSEEKDFPVIELTRSHVGWQTQRFCSYPQELTIQFFSPVHVNQIQIVSHEYKITRKLTIYSYAPEYGKFTSNVNALEFRKIGYIGFSSNEGSQFKMRELKTAHLSKKCLYMKFILERPFENKMNIFGQSGLIALNIMGDSISNLPKEMILTSDEQSNEMQNIFDAATNERLRLLENEKKRMVEEENFDEAKNLKQSIDFLKSVGKQIQLLNEQKALAIEEEDYSSAKVIKAETERLRRMITPESMLKSDRLTPLSHPKRGSKPERVIPEEDEEYLE